MPYEYAGKSKKEVGQGKMRETAAKKYEYHAFGNEYKKSFVDIGSPIQLKRVSVNHDDIIQCQFEADYLVTEKKDPSGFERAIEKKDDKELAEKIKVIQDEIKNNAGDKPIFLYMAVGTANAGVNGTNPSAGDRVTEEKLENQRNPGITKEAEKEHYVVVINIDNYVESTPVKNESRLECFINGVFPVAGDGTSEAIKAIKELNDMVYQSHGQVVLVNAIEDSKKTETEEDFVMFTGMRNLIPTDKDIARENFTYATSYLEQRDGFNLYKPIAPIRRDGRRVMGWVSNLSNKLEKMDDIMLN